MQRVRVSLPHFAEFGWTPIVLAVQPALAEGVRDELLLRTIPAGQEVERVSALPIRWSRWIGIGALGLRSSAFLYITGNKLIRRYKTDLVYFSTTEFPVMPLGRIWKKRFNVPFVVDMQDPWVSDYTSDKGKKRRGLRHRLARSVHRRLEPWTMSAVDGLIAVSDEYINTLQRRYPWLSDKPSSTLPFAASSLDFDLVRSHPQANRFFQPHDGAIHGAYVGRGGDDMALALRIIFGALRRGLGENPEVFSKVRLHFVGTDYAPAPRARKTIEPVAREMGVEQLVQEHPLRIPYFEALQLLVDADFLIVPGSDDPQYTASKLYPYILAKKPLLAAFHQDSSVVQVLRSTRAGDIVTFTSSSDSQLPVERLCLLWRSLLQRLPFIPETNWQAFEPYTARQIARRQCELFDRVLTTRRT